MKRSDFLSLWFWLLTSLMVQASLPGRWQQYRLVGVTKRPVTVSILQVGQQQYIEATTAAKLFPQGQYDAETYQLSSSLQSIRVFFAPRSLMLLLQTGQWTYGYQMPYPVVVDNHRILLPLRPLLKALEAVGQLQWKQQKRELHLQWRKGIPALQPLFQQSSSQSQEEPVVVTGVIPELKKGIYRVRTPILRSTYPLLSRYLQSPSEHQSVRGLPIDESARPTPIYRQLPRFVPPVFYQIPPGLRRPLPRIPAKKGHSGLEIEEEKVVASPLLATLLPLEWLEPASRKPLAVRRIRLERSATEAVIYLYANQPIAAYQRPEFEGSRLVLRIPKAIHRAGDLQDVAEQGRCKVQVEKIREILRYTFVFEDPIEDVDYRRIQQSRGLKFRVYFKTEAQSVQSKLQKEQQKWRLDVIVLDPGHGGKDAGAIGVTGVKEKDITLAIALEVGRLLRKELPEIKVVYTRTTDTFVELYRRGQIANQQQGKLFISIHCNSKPRKPDPARGCETYILRPGRNADALAVAQRENSVIRLEADPQRYQELTEEQLIIATMAQRAFVKFSELFAAQLQREVSRATGLPDRGVRQAGFLVLVGASMPNVLFEAGFLSNPQDERFLASPAGQRKIARGIVNAIKAYIQQYEKLIAQQH